MASKFYAVRKGKKPGIYRSWDACKSMIHGFSGAQYKSFATLQEAEAYMGIGVSDQPKAVHASQTESVESVETLDGNNEVEGAFAFVDGSFNIATGVYGYGGFLEYDGKREVLQGAGKDADMAAMRNVAGEVLGSMAAIERALERNLPKVTIYYDYMGIEMWALGLWKRNKKGTIAYYDYVQSVKDRIHIQFRKVKGHSGVEGNEEADRLAKQAVGINS